MSKIVEIQEQDLQAIRLIAKKIDANTAVIEDYKNYEDLLKKAGMTEFNIRKKMYLNGYENYEDYLVDRVKENKSFEKKIVLDAVIAAALFSFALVVVYWSMKGIIKIIKNKE